MEIRRKAVKFPLVLTVLAVGAVGAVGTAVGSFSSDVEKQQQGATKDEALAAVRARLAEQRKPVGKKAPQVYQRLTDTMAAASDAGASPDEINAEVLASEYLQWTRRGGTEAFLANNKSLANGHSTLTAPAPPKGEGGSKQGDGAPAAGEHRSRKQKPPEVKGAFANGVLNNSGPDLGAALSNLRTTLGQEFKGAYNPSFVDPKASAHIGQQGAMEAKDRGMHPDTKPLVDALAGPFAMLPGMVDIVANQEAYQRKLGELISRWNDEEAAKTNNAYLVMVALGRRELKMGNKVVLVGHSDGSFMVKAAQKTLDEEFGPGSVASLYIAPPFKKNISEEINKGDSRYVLLKGDFLTKADISRIDPNVERSGGQPEDLTGTDTHELNNYLLKGTKSRQAIIDAYKGLCDRLLRPNAGQGRGRQAPSCDVLPTPDKTETQAPGRTPGEKTPEGTPTRTGQPPEEPPGQTPEAPGGETPEEPPAQTGQPPEEPPGQTPEAPGGETPEEPPGQTPEAPGGETPEEPPAQTGQPPEEPPGHTPEAPPADTPPHPPA